MKTDELEAFVKLITERFDREMHAREIPYPQIGSAVYDLKNGRFLGVIDHAYIYSDKGSKNVPPGTQGCDYSYETSKNCFDNTSRQLELHYGSYEQLCALRNCHV